MKLLGGDGGGNDTGSGQTYLAVWGGVSSAVEVLVK